MIPRWVRVHVYLAVLVLAVGPATALGQQAASDVEPAEAQEQDTAENPFTMDNIAAWLMDHGPTLLAIIVGVIVLQWAIAVAGRRMVPFIIRGKAGSRKEREDRASTLVAVFQNTATVALYVGALLMILDAVGIPIAPLLGGAAVVGLAVAFGAQNLIKDYFSGFMILMENQYGINDVVKIAGISGLVERITLRITVLRDLDGTVHFIPHSQVTTVSNMTHIWSRALFDVGVAYKEDTDRVMQVLMDLGRELRQDPQFSNLILDDPEMLGVDELGDSAVVIKFYIKTPPLQQWTVRREMLRRIKRKFDELGIEIPFPHRTIYYQHANGKTQPVESSEEAESLRK